ncbi:aspartic proteinase-like protein 1-like [Hibiscus syriacus]|uniref:Aspartic proteinase-like protein 1-like n=1 Tax=Hibiscus syriacus TaxID=106335 RepID=A0A6A2X452_HIBSY|nr:aspartic proteinase-like protein 1-like [Hibiscus syriacus]
MGSKNKVRKPKNKHNNKPDSLPSALDSNNKNETAGGGSEMIKDARFASLHTDPRFQTVPKHKSKVVIDSRFNRMFTDKRFASSSAPLDKRGKPKKGNSQSSLRHYYHLEEAEGEEDKRKNDVASEEDDTEESDRNETLEKNCDEESEQEEEDSESGSTTEEEDVDIDYEDEEPEIQEENIPLIEKETRRLAVLNMDWRHVKAADLYVMLSSFLPKDGQIIQVAVYPSEFGLQRMKEEEIHGPVGLFNGENEDNEEEDDDEIDTEKLRAFERSRLRYYYAVVECDSSATADYLYKTCDGAEFERSSNVLDLRFIPDSMEFKHPPRDVAVELADLELKEFLASDESGSDDDENEEVTKDQSDKKNKKRDLYRALLQSGDGSEDDGEEDGQDMEVTFNTGLEDISKRILEKKDKEAETIWEAYLRKRREKKKAKKNKSKHSSEDESDECDMEPTEEPDDFFIEEPSLKKSKKGRKQNEDMEKEAEASREELELLLTDNKGTDTGPKGYNLKAKKTKGKRKKRNPQFKRSATYARQISKKRQKGEEEEMVGEGTKIPTDDPGMNGVEREKCAILPSKEKHNLSLMVRSVKMKLKQVQLPSGGKKKQHQVHSKKAKNK